MRSLNVVPEKRAEEEVDEETKEILTNAFPVEFDTKRKLLNWLVEVKLIKANSVSIPEFP